MNGEEGTEGVKGEINRRLEKTDCVVSKCGCSNSLVRQPFLPSSSDIAARNLLVVSPNNVKLGDFGLSRWLDEGSYYIGGFTSSSVLQPKELTCV